MKSNEVETLQECIRMIGGPEEYQEAVVFAAYLKTFKNSLEYSLIDCQDGQTFYVFIDRKKGLGNKIPNKYRYLFEEEE